MSPARSRRRIAKPKALELGAAKPKAVRTKFVHLWLYAVARRVTVGEHTKISTVGTLRPDYPVPATVPGTYVVYGVVLRGPAHLSSVIPHDLLG